MSEDLLKAVCAILKRDTRPGRGASEIVGHLMDLLYYGEFAIFEQVASSEHAEYVNIVGTKGPWTEEPPLWLISTLGSGDDPVPAAWASTGGEAREPRVNGGLVYGHGACGGKVDMVLKVLAASRIPADDLKRPVAVVGLYGSESHGTGMRALIDGRNPGAAIFGAPTNLELWSHHPGCITLRLQLDRRIRYRRMPPTRGMFELRLSGRSAHAQVPGLGDDAVQAGLDMLDRLREPGDIRVLVFDAGEGANRVAGNCTMRIATSYEELPPLPAGVEAEALPDGVSVPFPVDPLLRGWRRGRAAGVAALEGLLGNAGNGRAARPRVDVHTGWLASGRDSMAGTVTIWTGPGVAIETVVETFASAVQQSLAGQEEIEVDIRVQQHRPALASDPDSPFVTTAAACLAETGLPAVVNGGRYTTDGGVLLERSVPTLAFGPGRWDAQLYQDDEHVPLTHLSHALDFYDKLIRSWCGA